MEEAELLAIYFEEEGAHNYREAKKQKSTTSTANNQSEHVEIDLGGEDEIDASDPEYWKED